MGEEANGALKSLLAFDLFMNKNANLNTTFLQRPIGGGGKRRKTLKRNITYLKSKMLYEAFLLAFVLRGLPQ